MPKDKKKKSALAAAATRKLASIGAPQMTPEQLAHSLLHAEERGEVQRVSLDDGSWAWAMQDAQGQTRILKPTQAMLEALDRFEREGHPAH